MMVSFRMTMFPVMIALLLFSCNTRVNDKTVADTTRDNTTAESSPSQACYQRLEGTANQDTTDLKLTIEGTSVTGDMKHVPFEKDSRTGKIQGTIKGNIISGVWHFIQEGIKDSMNVEFKINDGDLLQKNYSVDPQTGRQILTDSSHYVLEYTKIDCKN